MLMDFHQTFFGEGPVWLEKRLPVSKGCFHR